MIKWFHRLRIAHKLLLVSVIFMIPDSLMLYLFITSINENIHVARLEQTGNEYQRAVEPLLKLIPEHRLLAHDPAHDPKKVPALRAEVDAAFVALKQVHQRIGETLDFTPGGLLKRNRQACEVDLVRRDWDQLCKATDAGHTAATDQSHLDLIANVRAMIAHAGDTSNLILDPELDSYYLMDTTLLALPQAQDRLTQVMINGLNRIRTSGPAHAEKTSLAIDLSRLRLDDVERIKSSIQITLGNANPAYGPNERTSLRLTPLLKTYADATDRFCTLLARLQASDDSGVTEAELLAAGRFAREASFELWYVADAELDRLLQSRMDYYTFRRTRSLAVAACALLAATLLVTFITRSISSPLKRQAVELRSAYDEAEGERKLAEARLVLQQKAETELRAAQDQLVTASRHAGMAEVATGVLHNVGNVLTSVNVSVHQIKDAVQSSQVAKLTRTADLIDAHQQDMATYLTTDPRGKLIPGYVSQLARLLDSENAAMLEEVESLSRGVEHIKQVVQFQQNYAKPSNVLETLDPADLLEDALRLNLIALDRHGVTIVREVQDVGPVRMDKHKTLQILVNLISNAKNAMSELNANHERRLTLGVSAAPEGDGLRLRLSVTDNGVGIAAENLTRIFAHGFTTRAQGHGFGLHSAANAAREMNGSIDVYSAGPGQGARFTLDLPVVSAGVTV